MEAAVPPAAPGGPSDYPVRFDVAYPERLSRWKIFVKWLLAIPQIIIVYLLGVVLNAMVLIAFFAILFTKKWPRGMFDFAVQIERWTMNVIAYAFLLMRDEYPPFSGDAGEYPVRYEVDYDDDLSRLLIFVKWLLVIPHVIVVSLLSIVAFFAVVVAWFAILFTGRYPRGLFDLVVGTARWYQRAYAYGFLLFTDRYPPFSLKP